jgi:hypothetical protein
VSLSSYAVEASFSALQSVHGESVTYRQGATSISITEAVRGRADMTRVMASEGVKLTNSDSDWLIAASDLKNGATQLEPRRDDEIEDEAGNVYRVLPAGPDAEVWKWHGNVPLIAFRIHTKERG